jgi:protein SCO1
MRLLIPLLTGCLSAQAVPPSPADTPAVVEVAEAPPSDSLYNLGMELTTHTGEPTTLAVHEGHYTLVSMFYASCPSACPMLISDMHALEDRLAPEVLSDLRVLMVSLAPDEDTPEVLTKLASDRGIDTERWTLATAPERDVRSLAAMLGISYRRMASGHINHTAVITLLDPQGRALERIEGLGESSDPIVAALAP